MPLAAPNLPAMYAFEENFTVALGAVMIAIGVPAYVDQQAAKIPITNVLSAVDIGNAIDEKTEVPVPADWPADQAPPQEYFRYPVNFEFVIGVPLDDNNATVEGAETMVGQLTGLIRAGMSLISQPFTAENLPYYRVTDIRPAGTSAGVMQQKNVYVCTMRFVGTFEIRNTAWPWSGA